MASGRRAQYLLTGHATASSGLRVLTSGQSTPPPGFWDMWADASDTNLSGNVGIANGATVTTWKNKGTGGSAYDWTATGAPKLQRGYLNAQSAVVGTGSTYFKSSHSPFTAGVARTMMFAVVTPAAGYLIATNDSVGYNFNWASGTPILEGGGAPTTTNCKMQAAPQVAQICIVEIRFDGNSTHLPTVRANGVSLAVIQNSGTGVGTETFTDSTYLAYNFGEGMGDFLGCAGLLADGPTELTRQWLSSKYGIAA